MFALRNSREVHDEQTGNDLEYQKRKVEGGGVRKVSKEENTTKLSMYGNIMTRLLTLYS